MHLLAVLALASALAQSPEQALVHTGRSPNIVLVIADDLGVDLVSCYGVGTAPPCTPVIDSLAARGVLFRRAWTNPLCSPSRAQIMTGRYAFRTGVGGNAGRWQSSRGLSTAELILPEVLAGYDSALVGKWHLAHPSAPGEGPLHPNASGFHYYAGSLFNLEFGPIDEQFDYFHWIKTVDGVEGITSSYATTDTANEAIYAAFHLEEPWLLVVSFNAPHEPRHEPPADLVSCRPATGLRDPALTRKMVEAMDTELGRVLDSIDPHAVVIFIGDNGTNHDAILPPFDPTHCKGTLYEGGVNVPLIIAGPGIVHGECPELVSSTDLFATIADLGGTTSSAEDSVSLVPYLRGDRTPRRDTVYVERFWPNHADNYETHARAIRTRRYKLIESTDGPDEFYDLVDDPYEQVDLRPNLSPLQRRAYDALKASMPTPLWSNGN
jgi:arylsulfatase A-like enzyme